MKRLFEFIRPLGRSHLLGLLIGYAAFQTMVDTAVVEAIIPAQLGFRKQAALLAATPMLCVVAGLLVFLASLVGSRSRFSRFRQLRTIPVLGRYCLFAGVVCGVVLLELLLLHVRTSATVQSLRLSANVANGSLIANRICSEVGDGVAYRWSGDEIQMFFLKDKREAVLLAIQKEHIAAKE